MDGWCSRFQPALKWQLSIVDLLLKVSTRLKWSKRYMGAGVELCTGCRGACGPRSAGRGITALPSSSYLLACRPCGLVKRFLSLHDFAFPALDWFHRQMAHTSCGWCGVAFMHIACSLSVACARFSPHAVSKSCCGSNSCVLLIR